MIAGPTYTLYTQQVSHEVVERTGIDVSLVDHIHCILNRLVMKW